jgi:hypothetical protein
VLRLRVEEVHPIEIENDELAVGHLKAQGVNDFYGTEEFGCSRSTGS